MSPELPADGVREITPVQFFPAGQTRDFDLDATPEIIKEGEEEEKPEKPSPKGSSAPESADSFQVPEGLVVTPTASPLSSVPAPPAPPTPNVTADKDNGPLKENENSGPTG
jgi:hypothetical protein